MPLYFFHIRQSDDCLVPDDEGAIFDDYEAARHEAIASILDIATDAARGGRKVETLTIEITDESGKTLSKVHASEIFN